MHKEMLVLALLVLLVLQESLAKLVLRVALETQEMQGQWVFQDSQGLQE